jgi:hypothetical protein
MNWRNALMLLGLVVVPMAESLVSGGAPVAGQRGAMYPDLRTKPASELHFDRLDDGTHILRFSSTVWNAGAGRLELEGDPHQKKDVAKKLYQNLYDAPVGGTRVSHKVVASDTIYHEGHQHYHFANFASYLLLKRDASGVYRETTKKGTKTSFCIMDTGRFKGSYDAQYTECGMTLQGLTVGWGDTYGYQLVDQWIVLGSRQLANGTYAVRVTADPKERLAESQDGNNVGTTCFRVKSDTITLITC